MHTENVNEFLQRAFGVAAMRPTPTPKVFRKRRQSPPDASIPNSPLKLLGAALMIPKNPFQKPRLQKYNVFSY